MKNRLLTAGEEITIRANIEQIEKRLKRPIPGGMVSMDDLKDHLLTTGELMTICTNIESIEKRHGRRPQQNQNTGPTNVKLEIIAFVVFVLIGLIYSWLG